MGFSADSAKFYCPNKSCADFGKRGLNNIVVYDTYGKLRRRLLRCRTCNIKFSERRITFSFGLHTEEGKIREVIRFLLAGKSIRATASAARIDKDTVHRIWKKFLSYCEESMDSITREFNLDLDDVITLLYRRGRKALR